MVPPFPSHPHPLWLGRGGWVSLPCSQLAWCPEPGPEPEWGGTVPLRPGLCQPPAPQGRLAAALPIGPSKRILGTSGESHFCPCASPMGQGCPYLLPELRTIPCTGWPLGLDGVGMWPPF